MQAFLEYVVKGLVDRPDAVTITPVEQGGQTLFELRLHPTDVGKIIGKQGRNIPQDKALDHVFGWTIGNDVSERTWQRGDRTLWRSKNSDTFCPMGPWITTGIDPMKLTVAIKVNGSVVASGLPTSGSYNMIPTSACGQTVTVTVVARWANGSDGGSKSVTIVVGS